MISKKHVVLIACLFSAHAQPADLLHFWDRPQYGGNSFNSLPPNEAYFTSLRNLGASWVRLSWDKWEAEGRDFLIGDADNYQQLSQKDLILLKQVLANADRAGLKVVITPLSLPWLRWSQNNGQQVDDRLWQDKARWQVATRFWRDLAEELKDQPGIAAYNLINEPIPEKMGGLSEHASIADIREWQSHQQGSARDLPGFYHQLISAIRQVDDKTPVMVDSGWYASAKAFLGWPAPLADSRVLYSFHMYEPYDFTCSPNARRKKPFHYPGQVTFGDKKMRWDAAAVESWIAAPFDWAKSQGVPANRIVAGEFGCVRTLKGCTQWLEDVLKVLDRRQSHWAFYSYRENTWDGMDYELGHEKVPWKYWVAAENKLPDTLPRRATPEFEPIMKRLRRSEP